jgi:hypothetical protein
MKTAGQVIEGARTVLRRRQVRMTRRSSESVSLSRLGEQLLPRLDASAADLLALNGRLRSLTSCESPTGLIATSGL